MSLAAPRSAASRPRASSRAAGRSTSQTAARRIVVHAAKGIARDIRDLVSGGEYFRDPFAHWLEACGYSALDPWRKGYISNFRKDSGGAWYSDQEGKLAARWSFVEPIPYRGAQGIWRLA